MFLGRKLAAGRDVMTFSGCKDHFNSQDNGGGMQILGIQRFPPKKTGITSGGVSSEHLFKVYGDWPQEPRCLMASGSATARFLQASRLEVPFLDNFWRTGS